MIATSYCTLGDKFGLVAVCKAWPVLSTAATGHRTLPELATIIYPGPSRPHANGDPLRCGPPPVQHCVCQFVGSVQSLPSPSIAVSSAVVISSLTYFIKIIIGMLKRTSLSLDSSSLSFCWTFFCRLAIVSLSCVIATT